MDLAGKVFWILVGVAFVFETIALTVAIVYRNNMAVYAFATPIQTALACIYFNYSVEYLRERKIGFLLAALSILLGVANFVFLQPISRLQSHFLLYSGTLVVALSLFGFFRIYISSDTTRLSQQPHFWLMATQLFFWIFTALFWTVYELFGQMTFTFADRLNLFFVLINIFYYLSIGLIFLRYPQMVSKS